MIQIMGFRYAETNAELYKELFFQDQDWAAPNVYELLNNLQDYISLIPSVSRYDIYFTLAETPDRFVRPFVKQDVIAFDIDFNIRRVLTNGEANAVFNFATDFLNINPNRCVAVNSGHGLHIVVGLSTPITNENAFDRLSSKFITKKINLQRAISAEIKSRFPNSDLECRVENIFGSRMLLRLPGTLNRKPLHDEALATPIVNNLQPDYGEDLLD